jgi:EAL domain
MVSRKLQQVSAPFASGVNPKVTGGRNLSWLAKNDDGPESVAGAGTNRRDNVAGTNMADNWSADLPACAIDVAQALRAGWLELWYQPKLGSQAFDLRGAEALIRMRHPQLGLVQPANFMPATRDPHFRALSQFVIDRALADWRFFRTEQRQLDMSINLPISFLDDPLLWTISVVSCPTILLSTGSSSRLMATTSRATCRWRVHLPNKRGCRRSRSRSIASAVKAPLSWNCGTFPSSK